MFCFSHLNALTLFIKISYYLTVKSLEYQQIYFLTSWFSTTILLLTSFPTSNFPFSVFISPLSFTAPQLSCCLFPDDFSALNDKCWFECITEIGYSESLMMLMSPVVCAAMLCSTPVPESWACDLTACWVWEYLPNLEHFTMHVILDWVEKTTQCLHLTSRFQLCSRLKSLTCVFGGGLVGGKGWR